MSRIRKVQRYQLSEKIHEGETWSKSFYLKNLKVIVDYLGQLARDFKGMACLILFELHFVNVNTSLYPFKTY